MAGQARCFLLPGMGASPEMYRPLKDRLGGRITALPWPPHTGERTLEEMAASIIQVQGIRDGDMVGGASLGGMVALEIAMSINASAVVLLGSALDSGEINPMLLAFSSLARFVPIVLIQSLAGQLQHPVAQMFATSEPAFLRAMCGAIQNWAGYGGSPKKVHRIHGRRDRVIRCPESGSAIIENGGHLIAMYHARRCADFISGICSKTF